MSGIGEGLAEAGQGALAAIAVEGAAVRAGRNADDGAPGHTHESACLNCGTPLQGSHCHGCGQAAHVHRTLGAFFHDLLHGVFHFEGKIWRTLPLLVFRPGRLTRAYIDGRRASYVSPLALFLFCVFLMFAAFHALEGGDEGPGAAGKTVNVKGLDAGISQLEREIGSLRTERKVASAANKPTDALDEQLEGKQDALDTLRDLKVQGVSDAGNGSAKDGARQAKLTSSFPRVAKALGKFRENPDLALYKLQSSAYKYSWALIPISVPFVWLLFPFSRRFHLYDHAVFVTYSLCFMTLLAIAAMVADAVGGEAVLPYLLLAPPLHMFAQLRGTYGLRRRSALWRSVLLVCLATSALAIFSMLIMAQSAL